MTEYLKMADVFVGEAISDADLLYDCEIESIADFSGYKKHCRYAAHAINHHDSLVTENEALRQQVEFLKGLIRNMQ